MTRERQITIIQCAECGQQRQLGARGLCVLCYGALHRRGELDRYPRTRDPHAPAPEPPPKAKRGRDAPFQPADTIKPMYRVRRCGTGCTGGWQVEGVIGYDMIDYDRDTVEQVGCYPSRAEALTAGRAWVRHPCQRKRAAQLREAARQQTGEQQRQRQQARIEAEIAAIEEAI